MADEKEYTHLSRRGDGILQLNISISQDDAAAFEAALIYLVGDNKRQRSAKVVEAVIAHAAAEVAGKEHDES